MNIGDLISPERVLCNVEGVSKKRVLQRLASLIAGSSPGLDEREVFDTLIGRERLGSTGMGRGVALPHGRARHGGGVVGAFVKLDQPVDFDAIDGQPVDLLFALLVPEHSTEEHLQILATLAEMFSDSAHCAQLRAAGDAADLYQALTGWQAA